VMDDAQSYHIEGKTHGGYTWQRQPMPRVIAKRLGRGASRELESIFRGPLEYVVRTERGWQTIKELPKQHPDWNDGEWYHVAVPGIHSSDMPADLAQIDPFGLPPAVYMPVLREQEESDRPYSNAQFARALPHEELAVVVSSYVDFTIEGDVAEGTLTDIGAQLLLVHDGHEYIKPVTAAGRFKLWMNSGQLVKYTLELAGILVIERDAVYVRQTSTTLVRDVGTASFDVPAYVRRKLGG
jgi:hypothetical protein